MLPTINVGGKQAKLYGIAGLGIYSVADYNNLASVSDVIKIGLRVGAGATMDVAPHWNVGLELNYHLVSKFSTFAPMIKANYHF
jgi:opacity protein-like surface antigen